MAGLFAADAIDRVTTADAPLDANVTRYAFIAVDCTTYSTPASLRTGNANAGPD